MNAAALSASGSSAAAPATRARLLFINRSYWPDTEATGQLLTELCEDLASTGEFDVHVLCGQPNHVSIKGEQVDQDAVHHCGVTIHRARHLQFAKKSMAGKLLNLMSFTVAAWRTSARLPRPDIVVTETDPFFVGLLGRRLQKRLGCRFIAYLQDIYPDIAVACGKAREGFLIGRLRSALFGAYSKADRVVVLSRDMKRRCIANGVSDDRIEIIPNWSDVTALYPVKVNNAFRKEHGLEGKVVVMYSGNMGVPHLLEPILDAAEGLAGDESVVFYFVGGGVQKETLQASAERRRLSNVKFLPYQPKASLSQSLSAADIQIVSVKPGVISCLMPSKVYGVLAAGCAVLGIAPPDSELGEMIVEFRFGKVCDPASPSLCRDLVDAIQAIRELNDPSLAERGHRFVTENASRRSQVTRFHELLRSLVHSPAASFPLKTSSTR
ncbi:putative glycosyl transferase [Caulifigura coniformis]|uniref:Putative glycosyl transferase n=1 Tax=Caulifigura coniformis TaxID=2527983 RepID=A0A517SIB5_9PLAN|nr:glycosyltransferase family 4 protein [Caulifigura coniformis]QDT55855.1 putative glycosyl transferase [Caulifigura coniformis]